jgi:signal transduction histidine kinase
MKKVLFLILAMGIIGLMAVFLAFEAYTPTFNTVDIHYIMHVAMESGSASEAAIIQENFLAQTLEDMDNARQGRDNILQNFMYIFILLFVITAVAMFIFYWQRIIKPFNKLQYFAGQIADGNLDVPLEMDEGNLFGAFTESFDLMRDELRTAKENENKANRSKKELVASLVHDVNTPVASVMSAIDILRLKATDENSIRLLDSANEKLQQIDNLITNMLQATLEELQELKVTATEVTSIEVCELISHADYENRAKPFSIPDCIVLADLLRLQQVFDNVIKNSYKYANTDIFVNAYIEEDYLFVEIQDLGNGVSESELPLITRKFYRGKNTEKTDGYGLGLYISKYFTEQMAGGLHPENRKNGFMVVIMLKLA